ncbi:helix-turn-helix domain-containing protein [Catenulispora subtropica]|uniref:HTH cro/C1-type domain-containing protein n=1 Tax=Catenulispora subtropica TaxID=450798 RepID=A0ABP5CVE1_9ACTN
MRDTGSTVDPRPGRRLRALRDDRGWSLSRLERETHYSRGYLSRVENGLQRMTEDLAQSCDRALATDGELLAAVRSGLGQECPYPGMTSYSEETARWFFGRDEAAARLLAEVRRQLRRGHGLYAVVAPSGAGKTSLLCAGLVPALRASDGAPTVRVTNPGPEPELPGDGTDVLVVDQFEEVFTQCDDPKRREAFVEGLCRRAQDTTCVVLGIRVDYLGHCLENPHLLPLLQGHTYLLPPMTDAQVRQAITGPADSVGLAVDPDLPELILRDLHGRKGAVSLPLLAECLHGMWHDKRGQRLGLAEYNASGGVGGALARSADKALADLGADGSAIARQVLLQLVRLGDRQDDTRRRIPLAMLLVRTVGEPEAVDRVVEHLIASRLVVVDDERRVSLTHEALLWEWPTLLAWIRDGKDELRDRQEFADAAARWLQGERDPGLLARGRLWERSEGRSAHLSPLEQDFYAASRAAHRAEQRVRTRQRRLRASLAAASAAALVAVVVVIGQLGRNQALEDQENADLLAAQSVRALHTRPEAATRMAISALRTADNPATRSAVLSDQATGFLGLFPCHGYAVNALAFRADGAEAASADEHGEVWRWNPDTRRAIGGPLEFGAAVHAVAYNPVSGALAVAAGDQVAVLSARGERLTLRGHTRVVRAVAYSADGRWIATGGDDGTARLWDAASGAEAGAPIAVGDGNVYAVAFSPDGKLLATGGEDGKAATWRADDHSRAAGFEGHHNDAIRAVAFSPDGATLVTGGWDGLTGVWSAATGRFVTGLSGHTDSVTAVAFDTDGRLLATASQDDKVDVWNTATWRRIASLAGHAAPINSVAFRPKTTGTTGTTGTTRPAIGSAAGPSAALTAGPPTETSISLATGSEDHTVALWDLTAGGAVHRAPGQPAFHGLAAARGMLATADDDGRATLWNGTTLSRRIGDGAVPVTAVALTADGTRLATGGLDGSVDLWDPRTAQRVARIAPASGTERTKVTALAFSPDGARLAAAGYDGTLRSWDVRGTAHQFPLISIPHRIFFAVAFEPDSRTLVTGSQDDTVSFWDGDTGARRQTLGSSFADSVLSVALSGRRLVAGGRDGTVRLWDDPQGAGLLLGYAGQVSAAVIAPDGASAATGDRDGTIRLWDLRGRRLLATLTGHELAVSGLAFPAADQLVSVSEDGTLRRWDLRPDRVSRLLRSRLADRG